MAVEDVNQNSNILSTHKLVLSITDGKCEAAVVMKRFIDIIKTKDIKISFDSWNARSYLAF